MIVFVVSHHPYSLATSIVNLPSQMFFIKPLWCFPNLNLLYIVIYALVGFSKNPYCVDIRIMNSWFLPHLYSFINYKLYNFYLGWGIDHGFLCWCGLCGWGLENDVTFHPMIFWLLFQLVGLFLLPFWSWFLLL